MDMEKEMLSSKYLKAKIDLHQPILVTISNVTRMEFDREEEKKYILHFSDAPDGKQLVLNKTNCRELIGFFGKDSEGWKGKQIVLFSVWTDFFKDGEKQKGIRLRLPKPQGQPEVDPTTTPPQPVHDDQELPF